MNKWNNNKSIYNGEVTVKELIEQLKQYPENWTISIMGCTDFYTNIVADEQTITFDEHCFFNSAFGDSEAIAKAVSELVGAKHVGYGHSGVDEDDSYMTIYFKKRQFKKVKTRVKEICNLVEKLVGLPVNCYTSDEDSFYPQFGQLLICLYDEEKEVA